jgi:hypothetical protein
MRIQPYINSGIDACKRHALLATAIGLAGLSATAGTFYCYSIPASKNLQMATGSPGPGMFPVCTNGPATQPIPPNTFSCYIYESITQDTSIGPCEDNDYYPTLCEQDSNVVVSYYKWFGRCVAVGQCQKMGRYPEVQSQVFGTVSYWAGECWF